MLRVAQAAILHNVCFAVSEPAGSVATPVCRDTNQAAKAAWRKTAHYVTWPLKPREPTPRWTHEARSHWASGDGGSTGDAERTAAVMR